MRISDWSSDVCSSDLADPAFVNVPVAKLISKAYADERRAQIDMARAQSWSAGVAAGESPNTTHVTVADRDRNIIASTQTINRSEENTSELQSLMRISYAVFCLKKKNSK